MQGLSMISTSSKTFKLRTKSSWFSGIPSVDRFHVHYIPDTCPVDAQSIEIWLISNSIPVVGVCNHFLFVVHPVRIRFEPLGPFLRPLCSVLFNSNWNGVQTSLYGNIPIQRILKNNKSYYVMNPSCKCSKQTDLHIQTQKP